MPFVRRKLKITEVSLVRRGANPGAVISLIKRDESPDTLETLHKTATQHAECMRDTGESIHSALARFWSTNDGKALRSKMAAISSPSRHGPAAPLNQAEFASVAAVRREAGKLVADQPDLTPEQARAQIWAQRPDLRKQYEAEREKSTQRV